MSCKNTILIVDDNNIDRELVIGLLDDNNINIINACDGLEALTYLRNNNPVVIAISTNDGLAGSAENIGKLLNRNNYFFVPFRQDNPITKPRSLVFDPKYIIPTLEKALEKEQVQPILI